MMVQGASRGLGLALVEALLERDDTERVFATSRAPDASEGLAALQARHATRLVCVPLDVRDEASIAAAARRIGGVAPRLHGLINCAGVLHGEGLRPEKRLEDADPERLRRSFEVNAFGPLLVAKHFLALLRHDEAAVVANVSARVGSIDDNRAGGWYGYRASKAAQNMFTKTLSIELGAAGAERRVRGTASRYRGDRTLRAVPARHFAGPGIRAARSRRQAPRRDPFARARGQRLLPRLGAQTDPVVRRDER